MLKTHELRDAFRFSFFTPSANVRGIFGDPHAMVIDLSRRQKKRYAVLAGSSVPLGTTVESVMFGIFRVVGCVSMYTSPFVVCAVLIAKL